MALAINAHRLLVITQRGQRLLTSTPPTSAETWQVCNETSEDTLTMIKSKRYFWAAVCADGGLLVCGQPHKFMDFLFRRTIPVQKMPRAVFGDAPAVSVACGAFHALVLTADGRVFAWGANYKGQLGLNVQRSLATPQEVFGQAQVVSSIAAGDLHSIAITRGGAVFAWGNGDHGQLGLGEHAEVSNHHKIVSPTVVPGVVGAVFAAAGRQTSMVVDLDGKVWSTGNNMYGQLGLGDRVRRTCFGLIAEPEAFCTQKISTLDCADDHTAAVTTGGDVWTWGSNNSGCLGHHEKKSSLVPTLVPPGCFGPDVCIASVFCGDECTAAVSTRGDFFLWGSKRRHVLGHRHRQELGSVGGASKKRASMPTQILMHGPVGRGARLALEHELAFAMVMHARLGRASVFFELHSELLHKILEACRDVVGVGFDV